MFNCNPLPCCTTLQVYKGKAITPHLSVTLTMAKCVRVSNRVCVMRVGCRMGSAFTECAGVVYFGTQKYLVSATYFNNV